MVTGGTPIGVCIHDLCLPVRAGLQADGGRSVLIYTSIMNRPGNVRAVRPQKENTMKSTLLAVLVLSTAATGAFAHASAEKTTPANEAKVDAVETIEVRFDDPMRVTAIKVVGPKGEIEIVRETGMEAVTEFKAAPTADLDAGAYTVEWRALSPDGHPMQGSFRFDVEG